MTARSPRIQPAELPSVVRLFPLPNLVLFPHATLPLHVFEPRYRALVEDALATDGVLALALLQPGWERDYDGRPQVSPMACLAQIVTHHRLPDGRFNLLIQGVSRAAIQRELPSTTPYRNAEVDLLDDFYPASGKTRRPAMQRRLSELARGLLPDHESIRDELDQLLASGISLGTLTDIFAYTFSLPLSLKQRLLSQWNVDRRAALLIDRLTGALRPPHESSTEAPSIPPFSLN